VKSKFLGGVLFVGVCAVMTAMLLMPLSVQAQGTSPNLLVDGDFEAPDPWIKQAGADGVPIEEVQVAPGWRAWYLDPEQVPSYVKAPESCDDQKGKPQCYWMRPEFRTQVDFAHHIHSGSRSQKYFSYKRMHEGGLYQRVTGITPGATLRFTIYMKAWMCDNPSACGVGGTRSDAPAYMHLRAGIDPTGGTDPFSPNIVWSPEIERFDEWIEFSVQAKAQGDAVTVFTHSRADWDWARSNNDVYVDDASLVVISQEPTAANQPGATQTPAATATAPCARLRWVEDVTIPDDSPVAPGARFVKTWRVKNEGTCVFSGTLHFIGKGNQMGGTSPVNLPAVEPGQMAEVSINLTAPTQPGDYFGTWQPRTTDGTPMENLVVRIKVVGGPAPATATPRVTATPLATPQAAPTQTQTVTPTVLPTLPPPTPTPIAGGLCLSAFEDANANNVQDDAEVSLADMVFVIQAGGTEVARHTTNSAPQPHCIPTLPPGAYSVQVIPPPGYVASFEKIDLILTAGRRIDLMVAGRRGTKVALTSTPTAQAQASRAGGASVSSTTLIVIALSVGILLVLLGVAVAFIRRGR